MRVSTLRSIIDNAFIHEHKTQHLLLTLNSIASSTSLYAANHIAQAQPYFGACRQLNSDLSGMMLCLWRRVSSQKII